jgi:hypothetical protein
MFVDMDSSLLALVGFLIILIGFAVILAFHIPSSKPKKDTYVSKENYHPNLKADFFVHNYLPHHSLRLDILTSSDVARTFMPAKTLISEIKPNCKAGLTRADVIDYLKKGNMLRFYVFRPGQPQHAKHYCDNVVNTEDDERVKAIRVGMVTSRFIGDTRINQTANLAGNAVNGQPWLKIHNLTELPIKLNGGKIVVKPHDTTRYLGYLHQGVPLGTNLEDDEGIYPTFQVLYPSTDVYFGVVSDIVQPLFGGFGLTYNDGGTEFEPMHLLQEGYY